MFQRCTEAGLEYFASAATAEALRAQGRDIPPAGLARESEASNRGLTVTPWLSLPTDQCSVGIAGVCFLSILGASDFSSFLRHSSVSVDPPWSSRDLQNYT